MTQTLQITEIYPSIQGESSYAGLPCTFVRLTGCPLRCRWCDTVYGFHGGVTKGLEEILTEIETLGVPLVELTGGEPLAQPNVIPLAQAIVERGYKLLVETGGSEPIQALPAETHIIMDIKCPGSKMSERNLWDNIAWLKPTDEIKFVVADRADFDWARDIIAQYDLTKKCRLLMSCAFGLVQPKDLASWILETKLDCRLNLQQHKYIWNPKAKGV